MDVAWYRKYRPKTIVNYIGTDIKNTVQARFRSDDSRPNVLMLHGPRGCGKTSFARIITKYYLCIDLKEGVPCEQCELCEIINESLIKGEVGVDLPEIKEVDPRENSGKNEIQSLIEEAIIPPHTLKYKIIIFDECHMISATAQNSLLKIIEDIPNHLVVIFCTTDPDKVIGTIHSRCQLKLEVVKPSEQDLVNRLMEISATEKISVSREALRLIVKKEGRLIRDSINLLERVAKGYEGRVTVDNVRESIKEVGTDVYIKFFEAANVDLEDVLIFNTILKEKEIQDRKFISGLNRFVLDALYVKYGIKSDEFSDEHLKKVKVLFDLYSGKEFDVLLQSIELATRNIGTDESSNELIITNLALKVGKIHKELISNTENGNKTITRERVKENKKSIVEYKKIVDNEIQVKADEVEKSNINKRKLADIIKGLSDVQGNIDVNVNIDTYKQGSNGKKEDVYLTEEEMVNLLD